MRSGDIVWESPLSIWGKPGKVLYVIKGRVPGNDTWENTPMRMINIDGVRMIGEIG
jgi:hypothetical protein